MFPPSRLFVAVTIKSLSKQTAGGSETKKKRSSLTEKKIKQLCARSIRGTSPPFWPGKFDSFPSSDQTTKWITRTGGFAPFTTERNRKKKGRKKSNRTRFPIPAQPKQKRTRLECGEITRIKNVTTRFFFLQLITGSWREGNTFWVRDQGTDLARLGCSSAFTWLVGGRSCGNPKPVEEMGRGSVADWEAFQRLPGGDKRSKLNDSHPRILIRNRRPNNLVRTGEARMICFGSLWQVEGLSRRNQERSPRPKGSGGRKKRDATLARTVLSFSDSEVAHLGRLAGRRRLLDCAPVAGSVATSDSAGFAGRRRRSATAAAATDGQRRPKLGGLFLGSAACDAENGSPAKNNRHHQRLCGHLLTQSLARATWRTRPPTDDNLTKIRHSLRPSTIFVRFLKKKHHPLPTRVFFPF